MTKQEMKKLKKQIVQVIKLDMLVDDIYNMVEDLAIETKFLDCKLSYVKLIKIQRIKRYLDTIIENIGS